MIKVKDTSRIPDLLKELEYLKNHEVQIGIFGEDDSFMAMIASVHEFGATIRPKGKYLTIPLKAELRDVKPRDIPEELFVPKGTNVLARKADNEKGFEALYALVKEVKIPERSFIRSAFDENKTAMEKYIQKLLIQLLNGEITGQQLLDKVGLYCEGKIKKKIRDLKDPPKSSITLTLEGPDKNNPLIETGRMRQSVVYKVVSK
ncbi:hypothetical protein [Anaerosolibacter sp.]|uniref:hypothetical protein n=1 Tax=Anaerosolibacter sp. TaxID=1872527 RepID=UPI0039F09E47